MRRFPSILIAVALLAGCSGNRSEHYSSPVSEGNAQKINLEEVKKAFWDTKAPDFNGWMSKFENRVNEIYTGDGIVSVDANRENNRMTVTGFIDDNGQQGFQSDDEKLFSFVQTGDVRGNEMPYRMDGYGGQPYYTGHQSILGNPLIQMMLFSHMMRYWTPRDRVVVLERDRGVFRNSPAYRTQKEKNRSFFRHFRTKADGTLQSNKGFKSKGFFGNGEKKRSWFGSSGSSSSSDNSWSGRRRSSSWGGSSGWGSRRSGGFSGSSGGWGGRRRR
ncbi:MAG: hypothetical protein ACM3YO_07970 [Bacteroidota bacterium]